MFKTVNFICILPQLKIIYIRQSLTWGFIHAVAPKVLEAENNFLTALWKLNPRLCGLTHFPFRKPILEVLNFFNSLSNQIASESISSKLQNRAVLFVPSYPAGVRVVKQRQIKSQDVQKDRLFPLNFLKLDFFLSLQKITHSDAKASINLQSPLSPRQVSSCIIYFYMIVH